MLHSSTSSEILLIKKVFIRFSAEKWRILHEKPVSARIYHKVLKNLAENIENLRRKASMIKFCVNTKFNKVKFKK